VIIAIGIGAGIDAWMFLRKRGGEGEGVTP